MKTKIPGYLIKAVFKGEKSSFNPAECHHKVFVWPYCEEEEKKGMNISFDFWCSIAKPKFENENELIEAFQCFLSGAIDGMDDLQEFADKFGYNISDELPGERRKAIIIYNKCFKARQKIAERWGLDDDQIYDLYNNLAELSE